VAPNSPDLNPLDYLYSAMLEKYHQLQPKTTDELKAALYRPPACEELPHQQGADELHQTLDCTWL